MTIRKTAGVAFGAALHSISSARARRFCAGFFHTAPAHTAAALAPTTLSPARLTTWAALLCICLFCLVLSGCKPSATAETADTAAQNMEKPKPVQPPAPVVGVVRVEKKPVRITRNLPGRLSASRSAAVRARVTGIVQQRLFKEGSLVKRGQPLFQIDNRPFLAALQSAKAQLAQAKAAQVLNQADVKRYSALLEEKAISRQVYEQAVSRQEAAKAAVDMARAAVTQAQLNLDYAKVTAPISGYIGRAEVTEGALVSAASATQMAQIQQIDPLYVTIRQSGSEMMKMRRIVLAQLDTPPRSSEEFLSEHQVMVDVFLDDGTPYPMQGKLLFADVHVDESMGETSLRATLPNPQHLLMPGLYVRVEVPQMRLPDAVLLPQQAVRRRQKDTVLVVNEDNSFASRTVNVVQSQGNNWIISDGLEAGEQVIVDGVMHLRGASVVKPVPWQSEEKAQQQKAQQQKAQQQKAQQQKAQQQKKAAQGDSVPQSSPEKE